MNLNGTMRVSGFEDKGEKEREGAAFLYQKGDLRLTWESVGFCATT